MTPEDNEVVAGLGIVIYVNGIGMLLTCVFYGFYIPTAAVVFYLFLCQRATSWSKKILLACTITLFLANTWDFVVHLGVELSQSSSFTSFTDLDDLESIFNIRPLPWFAQGGWPACIGLILNDVIVSWRAKVVWSGAKLVQCGLLLVLVAAIGVNLTDSIFGNLNINTLGNSATNLDFASLFVSFAVNWTATLMVTVKFWKHRQAVKFLYKNPSQSQSLTILLALVESGIIFCLVQLFYAIWTVIDFFSVENSPVDMTYRVIDRMFNAVVALYPMVVIILVNVKKLPLEETFYYDVRIHVHDSSDDIELDSVH